MSDTRIDWESRKSSKSCLCPQLCQEIDSVTIYPKSGNLNRANLLNQLQPKLGLTNIFTKKKNSFKPGWFSWWQSQHPSLLQCQTMSFLGPWIRIRIGEDQGSSSRSYILISFIIDTPYHFIEEDEMNKTSCWQQIIWNCKIGSRGDGWLILLSQHFCPGFLYFWLFDPN